MLTFNEKTRPIPDEVEHNSYTIASHRQYATAFVISQTQDALDKSINPTTHPNTLQYNVKLV